MNEQIKVIILGAGGHARVIADCIVAQSELNTLISLQGFIDPKFKTGTQIGNSKVLGDREILPKLVQQDVATHFIVGLGTIRGGSSIRREIFEHALTMGLRPVSFYHPSAVIAPDVKIGLGTVIMAGAVLNTGTQIGDNVIINTRSSIDHDCKIKDDVHIAPGCVLSGNITIGERTHIGVGSCIVQGVRIAPDVTAGAGTVIIKDVEAGKTIVGAPQRII